MSPAVRGIKWRAPGATAGTLADVSARAAVDGVAPCTFPVGDDPGLGQMDRQLFCGAPARDGSTYCADHHKTCHKPAKKAAR